MDLKSRFPFGAVYLIEQGRPFEEMARDLDNMKAVGFDLITMWPVANAWLAKRPDEFAFADTRRFLDMCQARGMQVIAQLIGQNPSQEFMPDALLKPEMFIQPPGNLAANCFWCNFNHPEVDRCIQRYVAEAVTALKDHPAIFAWDIFNEAHFRSDDPWTTALYRQWLQKKYGTIEELNRQWHRRFASFEQVTPDDRNSAYSVWSSLLPSVDYERFRADNLTDICRRWVGYVKAADAGRPVIIDGSAGWQFSGSVVERNHDEFDTAAVCDIFGSSFYPKSWGRYIAERPWELSMYMMMPGDAARRAGKPYFIDELQTHTQSVLTPGSEVSPDEIAAWIWTGISAGAKGFQLWRWRPFLHGYQSTGRGLTQLDGTPGPRAESVKGVVAALRRNEQAIVQAKPIDPAAVIVYSYRSRLFFDAWLKWQPSRHPDALKGWYRAFWSSGLAVRTAELRCLSADDLRAPVIVLPSLVAISDADAQRLADYAFAGGTLVADARLGVVDEQGVVRAEGLPGRILSNVFGVREIDVGGAIDILMDRQALRGAFLSQQLEICGANAEVIGRTPDDRFAVVESRYGQGRALYFAAHMGETFNQGVNPVLRRRLLDLVLESDAHAPWAQKPDTVHFALHHGDTQFLAYVVNLGPQNEQVVLHNCPGVETGVDLISGERIGSNQFDAPARSTRLICWAAKPRVPSTLVEAEIGYRL